jgi:hypothetical protein
VRSVDWFARPKALAAWAAVLTAFARLVERIMPGSALDTCSARNNPSVFLERIPVIRAATQASALSGKRSKQPIPGFFDDCAQEPAGDDKRPAATTNVDAADSIDWKNKRE